MPRAKRVLADADRNSTTASPAKRLATVKGSGKENADMVGTGATGAGAEKPTENTSEPSAMMSASTKRVGTVSGKQFPAGKKDDPVTRHITMPDPQLDPEDQEDDDEGVRRAFREAFRKNKEMNRKPAAEHPGWKWIITEKADDIMDKFLLQAQRRDQDGMRLYFYNDFTGYGQQEVIENMLVEFHNQLTKKRRSIPELWNIAQAVGFWFLLCPWLPAWGMIDDGDRVAVTIRVIGRAVLATIDLLKDAGHFKPDSGMKNLPLVLTLYLQIAREFGESLDVMDDETPQYWPCRIIARAQESGIELSSTTGVKDTEELLKHFAELDAGEEWVDDDDDEDVDEAFPALSYVDRFKDAYEELVRDYGTVGKVVRRKGQNVGIGGAKIGGSHFDVAKFTKRERKAAAYDGVDPFDVMGPPP